MSRFQFSRKSSSIGELKLIIDSYRFKTFILKNVEISVLSQKQQYRRVVMYGEMQLQLAVGPDMENSRPTFIFHEGRTV